MNILNVIASPMGNASNSIKIGNAIVEKIQEKHPNSVLKIRDLNISPFPHITESMVVAIYTPAEHRTDEQKKLLQKSDEAVAELFDADIIIISTPMYNLGIPSSLKAWIDHISRAGVTFSFSEAGPEGLVKNKKAYLAISTGGVFSDDRIKHLDFTERPLLAVLDLIGITDVTTFRNEGVAMPATATTAMAKSLESIENFNF
jgi:FMN-dependent NADH-azoreductase